MKTTLAVVAGSCLALASSALAQTASLRNGGFEIDCIPEHVNCFPPFPLGFHSPGNDPISQRRSVGDGLTPALSPVGTPGALTPHTGNSCIEVGTYGTGGFEGLHTDHPNWCYCGETCPPTGTFCPFPLPFFDPAWDYDGGDVVVSVWYMIPADEPITGDGAGIKLRVKVLNQPVATLENFDPLNGAITGHTDGQWRQHTVIFPRDQVEAQYNCTTGVTPDCGCGCAPVSPRPDRVMIELGRFVGDGTPTSGRIFWDDLTYMQLPVSNCGSADFDGDGDTGTDADIEAFFACLGGNCCPTCGTADFDGDGDTGTDADIEAFFRVLGGGTC